MALVIRTIGLARAKVKIGLVRTAVQKSTTVAA